jgi:hypothetical protein
MEHDERITVQSKSGITEVSKKFVLKHIDDVVLTYKVSCVKTPNETLTTIHTRDKDIIVDGFSFGYVGEGSRGLEWLLRLTGMDYRYDSIYEQTNSHPNETLYIKWLPHSHTALVRKCKITQLDEQVKVQSSLINDLKEKLEKIYDIVSDN